jgi:hypothetical protein
MPFPGRQLSFFFFPARPTGYGFQAFGHPEAAHVEIVAGGITGFHHVLVPDLQPDRYPVLRRSCPAAARRRPGRSPPHAPAGRHRPVCCCRSGSRHISCWAACRVLPAATPNNRRWQCRSWNRRRRPGRPRAPAP